MTYDLMNIFIKDENIPLNENMQILAKYNPNSYHTDMSQKMEQALHEELQSSLHQMLLTEGNVTLEMFCKYGEEYNVDLLKYIEELPYTTVLISTGILYNIMINDIEYASFDINDPSYNLKMVKYHGKYKDKEIYTNYGKGTPHIETIINIQKPGYNLNTSMRMNTSPTEIEYILDTHYGLDNSHKIVTKVFDDPNHSDYITFMRQKTIDSIINN